MDTSDGCVQDVITCDLLTNQHEHFKSCQVILCETCVKQHREDLQNVRDKMLIWKVRYLKKAQLDDIGRKAGN